MVDARRRIPRWRPFRQLVLLVGILGACSTDASVVSLTSSTEPAPTTTETTTTARETAATTLETTTTTTTTVPPAKVRTGADILVANDFSMLADQRVGLIANHTSRVGDDRLIDVMAESDLVDLAAIFAPEHGVSGTADAGELLEDDTDPLTAIPIHSLYGETVKPTPEMLVGLDVLVYDLQDVGTRFYTYISTMGLAMEAAAEADLPFVVLDRPNPLGGNLVSGFVREPAQASFVSQYPIPSVYGLTAGELARAIVGEGWMPGITALDLTVVEMQGWARSDRWPDTELPWVAPSPGLPEFASAATYPGIVLFEATSLSYGTGTREPFSTAGAPWDGADPDALAAELNARAIPGVRFEPRRYVPQIQDISPNPRLEGESINGVHLIVEDPEVFDPVATGVHLIEAFMQEARRLGEDDIFRRPNTFALLAGTPRLRQSLLAGTPAVEIIASWSAEVEEFRALRAPYLIYR